MKARAIAEVELRLEEIAEDITKEEFERREKEIDKIPIEELEEEIKDCLGVDSAKILSWKVRTEIMEQ